jgi:hypothetical protein
MRTDIPPLVPQEQYSSTSVAYSLENIDALSRLANAGPSNGIVRRHSLSLDSTNPFDTHLPIGANSSVGVNTAPDNMHTHAEKEEHRQKEYENALKLAREVIQGLDTLHRAPLASAQSPTYGLAQRRSTERTDVMEEDNDDTPSAARRYASFMRNEGLQQGSANDTSRVKPRGMSGSPAKLVALLTRCVKTCPDILAELDFNHLVDV